MRALNGFAAIVLALGSSSSATVIVGCGERPHAQPTNGGVPPTTSSSDAGSRPRYLALGDSFTIGTGSPRESAFPSRLVVRWQEAKCDVDLRNVAVNGYTTDDLIERELPEIDTYRPTFITVAIGANDIVRGSTPEDYRVKVKRILQAATAAGSGAVRVVVIPQPDWSQSPVAADFGDRTVIANTIRRFNAILATETKASGATYVDLSPLMERQAQDKMIASDGLHPSAAAYGAWADELAKQVRNPCP